MNNARQFSRAKVEVKDVISIMVSIISVEASILLAWQFVAPLRWARVVVATSDLGYPIQSIGMCSSENPTASLIFVIVLFVLNLGCILTAVVLCLITRDIKSALNEGMWIAAAVVSILQILVVAVPIAIIASEDTSASFFVTSAAVFIMSKSSYYYCIGSSRRSSTSFSFLLPSLSRRFSPSTLPLDIPSLSLSNFFFSK
jgi:hypothetical protein